MMSKRFFSLALTLALVFGLFAAIPITASSAGTIEMVFTIDKSIYTVNGVSTQMDTSPMLIESRTMLPIRFVAEPLGAAVDWDGATEKVTIKLMDTKIELWIGQSNAVVNGKTVPIDPDNPNVKPLLISARTMLPIRFVTENLGCDVGWNGATQEVTITWGTDDPGDEDDGAFKPIGSGISLVPGFDHIPVVEKTPITLKPGITAPIKFSPEILEQLGHPQTVTEGNKGGIKTLMDIGRGFDVFDRYASGLSLRNAVLDADKLVAAGQIQRSVLYTGDFREIEGKSLKEYSTEMTTKAKVSGGFMCFKASVETSFSSAYRSKATSYYDTINYLIMQDNLFIKGSCNYKDYVLPDVKAILDTGKYNGKNWTPAEIFEKYGGYVLVDGIFGGRLEYNVTADSEYCSSYNNFKSNVKASYNVGFASVSGEVDHEEEMNKEQFNSNSSTTVITYGGSAQDGKSITDKSGAALQTWRDSVPDRSVLVEFGPTGALIPIWELCSSQARADELKTAFNEYSKGKQTIFPSQKYLTHLALIAGKTKEEALSLMSNYPGFVSTNIDLNGGRGSYRIYLIYKLSEKSDDESYFSNISQIFIEKRKESAGPDGGKSEAQFKTHNGAYATFTRIPMDLNMGTEKITATGIFGQNINVKRETPYIYLWFRGDQWQDRMITKIEVIESETVPKDEDGWIYAKWQDTPDAADCNEGNTKDIYIRYKNGR